MGEDPTALRKHRRPLTAGALAKTTRRPQVSTLVAWAVERRVSDKDPCGGPLVPLPCRRNDIKCT